MTFRGQDPLCYRLTKVEPSRGLVDETAVGDIVVRVSHRLERLATGRLRVPYAAEIDGPRGEAERLCPLITAEFPDTMAPPITRARERSA